MKYLIRHNRIQKEHAGFSLLEIVIALAIISGGLVAIFILFPTAQKLLTDASANTNISNLARTEMSRVRVGGALSTGLNSWLRDNAYQQLETTASAYELYQHYGASASRVPMGKGLYRVTFKVRLNDGREERFVTYVTELQ